ncbi:MAG TPA: DUF2147 domain-containing protein [Xanthobacteraceae bacterium]|nr:DUF2147 domain-containing protein [Xanthobacteraceae bacterium]
MRVKSVLAKSVVALAALVPLLAAGSATPADLSSPVGLWQAVDDDTKQPTGWFLIANHDGVYSGIIAKMFMKPGDNPNPVCDKCTDDRTNHPWLGLEIIRDMKQEEPDKYGGGNILDPRDGKVYHATMKLTQDGQTLVVRGYLGIELLGKNTYWTRLPDSAYSMLDPSINPNTAVNPNAAKHPPGAPIAPVTAQPAHRSELRGSLNTARQ